MAILKGSSASMKGAGRTSTIKGSRRRGIALHLSLIIGLLLSVFPFYWAVIMSTHSSTEIFSYPPKLLPGSHFLENVRHLFDNVDFFGSMFNSLLVACSVTVLVLFFDSLAAFVFAKFQFPGRRVLFALMMVIFMVPAQLQAIPQFVIMAKLGWIGSMTALIVPAAANAFGIFWMRQYMKSAIHDELIDASKLDGAGFLRQYWHVALPVVRPGLAFLGIFTFMGQWNDYAWPLIALTNPDNVTLQVALSQLNGVHGTTDYGMVMTGALLALIPLLIVFAIGAKQIIADLGKGAIR
ncbi:MULTISPECIES: carbohydrate ABC transporter permease [Streptomyces]|jgi:cellobiose transport system permease protein|uniref:carbohydrate ABC transporter permease n=1 Tax=Streptomyces TaxID=1883 RepID=UPI000BC5F451|nr:MULTISPECIES: carbohydrate ABC transporter permease [unclassified Streptomyces]PBC94632.1 carbohydrate ABC transporter membrane protein 2 (CUT1 family) [Streptomyces sp. Ag82_O1-15]SOE56000.1 carbohydrate ABC transporter membrane protein 2, CUT1 family [Streptomyces sp. OV198]